MIQAKSKNPGRPTLQTFRSAGCPGIKSSNLEGVAEFSGKKFLDVHPALRDALLVAVLEERPKIICPQVDVGVHNAILIGAAQLVAHVLPCFGYRRGNFAAILTIDVLFSNWIINRAHFVDVVVFPPPKVF